MLGVDLKKVFATGCCPSASTVCGDNIFWVSFTKLPGENYSPLIDGVFPEKHMETLRWKYSPSSVVRLGPGSRNAGNSRDSRGDSRDSWGDSRNSMSDGDSRGNNDWDGVSSRKGFSSCGHHNNLGPALPTSVRHVEDGNLTIQLAVYISKIFPMRQAGHMLYDKLQHLNWGQNKASIATYLQSMNMEEVSKVRSQD
ncbi:uncharacterized protein BJ212DRAFT_1304041 [Suillus subaureus]|uniref:Uncharacterized protein n=1 Tax=Suillus subaureus TaxID=48587 RepID=A0A9P7DWY3_9AGAM|nr:uncharacterized protein BJ212DRAFT_1304041 [Suillus subaureus]KAG1805433.1 hypothetical protein BJ212DRAFT_1304041 [Suillus subaureus]